MAKKKVKTPGTGAARSVEVLEPGLIYPTDPAVIDRLRAGEEIPWENRGMCEPHDVGDVVDDVPANYVGDLVAQGLARFVEEE